MKLIQDRLKLKEGYVFEDASELEEGDPVEITGNVKHRGRKGTIDRFGSEKKFVVVKFNDGSKASFHSSDVSKADEMYDDEDDIDEDEDPDTFYVAFYDEDEDRSWIGMVTKEDGGKWREENYKGEADYRWGQSYMSYLTPHDVMNWIHKDYRGMEIKGPFFDAQEAEDYVNNNWGNLEKRTDEGLKITAETDASDLLKMVSEKLTMLSVKRAARKYIPGQAKAQIKSKIKDQQFTQALALDGDPDDPENKKDIAQTSRNIRRLKALASKKLSS